MAAVAVNEAVDRFVRAADAVRRAFEVGDDDALGEWAGTADALWLDHVRRHIGSGDVGELAAARLVGLRRSVLRTTTEVALAAADAETAAEIARQLQQHLIDHPGDDALVALRMRALATAGDPDAAVAAYDEHRAGLAASTGLEPSRSLVELREAVVAGRDVRPRRTLRPFLLVSRPDGGQDVVALPREGEATVTIGRSDDRSLPLPHDAQVSRRHAEIRTDGDGHVLLDVGSSNGTKLNNRPVQAPMRLVDGDLVKVGSTMLIYRDPANATATGVPIASGTMVQVMPTPSSVHNPARDPVEELDVTIFFCDLRGWTAASGEVTPQKARELLDAFYDLGAEVVTRHGGTVLQMAGDEVYACFGAPVPQADHAARALRAALDLQAHEDAFITELGRRDFPPVRFGIGLNSGPVAPFSIGAADRRQLGLVGSTVNVAARLCSEAGAGQIVYAAAVAERLTGPPPGTALPPLDLKNVAEPVHAFRIADSG